MSVAAVLQQKLTAAFAPSMLEIQDESPAMPDMAEPPAPMVPGETHFHVRLVSQTFEGLAGGTPAASPYDVLKGRALAWQGPFMRSPWRRYAR
jgi:hypothetical protein